MISPVAIAILIVIVIALFVFGTLFARYISTLNGNNHKEDD